MTTRRCYWVIAAFTVLLACGYAALDRLAPGGRRLVKIEGVDTVNYFDVTHSLVFDHDFNLNNEYVRVPPSDRELTPIQSATGLPASPWPVGYSLIEIPALVLGTLLDAMTGSPADGYSWLALYCYCLENVFLAGLGMFFLFRLLSEAAPGFGLAVSEANGFSLFIAFAVFAGTNVGYYSLTHLSHTATILFATIFLWWWWKIKSANDARSWMLLGVAGGCLSICRWQDLIFLGGPFLFDLIGTRTRLRPLVWLQTRLLYIFTALACWIPQLIEWKVIYGKYVVNPHQGDVTFSFPPPYLWLVLLSSRNGWLLWTPLIGFGLAGLAFATVRSLRLFAPWIAVIVLELILIGSMNEWHGGDSFSSRYMMSTTPIVAIGILALFSVLHRAGRTVLACAMGVCCVYTVLFAVQLRLWLIPSEETLTSKELLSDKLHILSVRRQKAAASRARELAAEGRFDAAGEVLADVAKLGDDRDVLAATVAAYRAGGRPQLAEQAEARRQRYLATRLN